MTKRFRVILTAGQDPVPAHVDLEAEYLDDEGRPRENLTGVIEVELPDEMAGLRDPQVRKTMRFEGLDVGEYELRMADVSGNGFSATKLPPQRPSPSAEKLWAKPGRGRNL